MLVSATWRGQMMLLWNTPRPCCCHYHTNFLNEILPLLFYLFSVLLVTRICCTSYKNGPCNLPKGLLFETVSERGITVTMITDSPAPSLAHGEVLLYWLTGQFDHKSSHLSMVTSPSQPVWILLSSLLFVFPCTEPISVKLLWACNSYTQIFSWLFPLLPSSPLEDPTKQCLLSGTLLSPSCSLYLWPKAGQRPSHPSAQLSHPPSPLVQTMPAAA